MFRRDEPLSVDKKLLERIRSNDPTLRTVDLRWQQIDDVGATELANAFKNNQSITNLSLSHNPFGFTGANALISSLPNLTGLTILDMSWLSFFIKEDNLWEQHNKTAKLFAHLPRFLVSLDLRCSIFKNNNMDVFIELLKHNQTLKMLHLGGNLIDCEKAANLIEAINVSNTITVLNLSSNTLYIQWTVYGEKDRQMARINRLAKAFANNRSLTMLSLNRCGFDDDVLKILVDEMKTIPTLTWLDISCDTNFFSHSAAGYTIQAMNQSQSMRTLNIAGCRETKVGQNSEQLKLALAKNKQLTSVDLSNTSIPTDELFKILTTDKILVSLGYKGHDISDEIGKKVIDLLSENSTLTSLDIDGLSDAIKLQIEDILKRNKKTPTARALPPIQLAYNVYPSISVIQATQKYNGYTYPCDALLAFTIKMMSAYSRSITIKWNDERTNPKRNLLWATLLYAYAEGIKIARPNNVTDTIEEYEYNDTPILWGLSYNLILTNFKKYLKENGASLVPLEQLDWGYSLIQALRNSGIDVFLHPVSQKTATLKIAEDKDTKAKINNASSIRDNPRSDAIFTKKSSDQKQLSSTSSSIPAPTFSQATSNSANASISSQYPMNDKNNRKTAVSRSEPAMPPSLKTNKPAANHTTNTKMLEIAMNELQYKDLDIIGQGSFGQVYKGSYKGNTVAVKKLFSQVGDEGAKRTFTKEADTMSTLDHPNIVKIIGICLSEHTWSIVMEYAEGGNLYSFLRSNVDSSLKYRFQLALGIAEGLCYLHGRETIHCDVKTVNVLIKNNQAILCDFGFAQTKLTIINSPCSPKEAQGTTHWMAPELFTPEGKNSKATDVYSYAIVLWELCNPGKMPYEGKRKEVVPTLVKDGYREQIPASIPTGISQLIKKCWDQRAEQRGTVQEALNELRTVYNSHFK